MDSTLSLQRLPKQFSWRRKDIQETINKCSCKNRHDVSFSVSA